VILNIWYLYCLILIRHELLSYFVALLPSTVITHTHTHAHTHTHTHQYQNQYQYQYQYQYHSNFWIRVALLLNSVHKTIAKT